MLQEIIGEFERGHMAELFQAVSGYDHPVEMFTFSTDPKLEVAYGLLAAGGTGALALQSKQLHNDSILGEDLLVSGTRLPATARLRRSIAWSSWPSVSRSRPCSRR